MEVPGGKWMKIKSTEVDMVVAVNGNVNAMH
jgi:hypothetical protein